MSTGIPADLVQAFRNAVGALDAWQSGSPEPSLLLRNRPYSIGEIANWVSVFKDPMPADLYEGLRQLGGLAEPLQEVNFVAGGPPAAVHCYQAAAFLHQRNIGPSQQHHRHDVPENCETPHQYGGRPPAV